MTPEQRERLEKAANKANVTRRRKKPEPDPNGEPPARQPEACDLYYEINRNKFWTLNARKEWQLFTKENVQLLLRAKWYSPKTTLANTLTIVEAKLLEAMMEHSVEFGGELAGWPEGTHDVCGKRIFVTKAANRITPKRGPFPLIRKLVKEWFGKDAVYFAAWLKCALVSRDNGAEFQPGQMLVLAGLEDCGKSLCQQLITQVLGGRVGLPYRYLSGQSTFNEDLIGAEHLMLEDEEGKSDHRSRRLFGAAIKKFVACKIQSAHPKGGKAFPTEPFWRLTASLNDEPEQLRVLPPLHKDIKSKLMMLKVTQATLDYPTKAYPTAHKWWNAVKAEIPAYVYALYRWEIPKEIRHKRWGVVSYQNPELVRKLNSLSEEAKLWTYILESGILPQYPAVWSGSSTELEEQLKKAKNGDQVAELLKYSSACGVFLSRLADQQPENVEKEEVRGNQKIWHLARDKS